MEPMRINCKAECNTPDKTVKKNVRQSRRYPRCEWGVLLYPPCAVVGGSPNLVASLDTLREWKGDIFAVNATAGYLSDRGIPHHLFAIDCDPNPWRIGPLTKGAVMASRVHREQMKQFKRNQVRIFDMAEESNIGIEGGPTACCRAPHLFLRMGYMSVYFFGIDGCFTNRTHIDGTHTDAHGNMMIIRVNDVDYVTNAAMMLQHQFMIDVFNKYPLFLHNASGGLLKAMYENQDTWEVVAITDDLKSQYTKAGVHIWNKEYQEGVNPIWQPQQILSQQLS